MRNEIHQLNETDLASVSGGLTAKDVAIAVFDGVVLGIPILGALAATASTVVNGTPFPNSGPKPNV